jgi:hypothetical protein
MARVAANVAAHKERRPDLYCPERRCLWRTGGGFCPRHWPVYDPKTGVISDPNFNEEVLPNLRGG